MITTESLAAGKKEATKQQLIQVLEGVVRKQSRFLSSKNLQKQLKRDSRFLAKQKLFDSAYYCNRYPDVVKSGIPPVEHYVLYGWAEFRNPNELFDTFYYLNTYRDVLSSPLNPLVHFILHGCAEMRNPCKSFSVRKYLDDNPDVAASGMNPLLHYLHYGRNEGWYRFTEGIHARDKEFAYPDHAAEPAYQPEKNVLYLLHNSLPYNSGGYAARTHGLLQGVMTTSPFTVHGVSRPGYPTDHKKYISRPLPHPIPEKDVVDGVLYLRCDQDTRRSGKAISEYSDIYANQVVSFARKYHSAIIHAASNHPNGLAATIAARRLKMKSIYEVRGLWEITRLSRQEDFVESQAFSNMVKMETTACTGADAVITITSALKDLLVERGVPDNKIVVVPNCVDVEKFVPCPRDEALAARLHIDRSHVVIGYIGSIVNYEGLDRLLQALHIIREQGVDNFRFLLVGDGAEFDNLKKLASSLNLDNVVIAPGRVPFEEVPRYYSLVDIAPFPREPHMVCEIVSPLKPFEAMSLAKGVLVSSCAALTEIVADGKTGIVFEKGNTQDLVNKLKILINNSDYRLKLGDEARRWVHAHRKWSDSSRIVADLYGALYDELVHET